jgi:hypothetical protein
MICLIYAGWQLLISVIGPNRIAGLPATASAVVVGAANAGCWAASIIGLTATTGLGES